MYKEDVMKSAIIWLVRIVFVVLLVMLTINYTISDIKRVYFAEESNG